MLNRSNSQLMKLGCFIFKKQHLPLHTDIQQQQIKLEETKQNRKKSLTCFSQTCICKHQEFYLLDQMAQAHWSHTFLVLFEDTEWALTSHLPPSFSEWHQRPPTVTAPLSERFSEGSEENSSPERGKPGGSAPQLCPAQDLLLSCCAEGA